MQSELEGAQGLPEEDQERLVVIRGSAIARRTVRQSAVPQWCPERREVAPGLPLLAAEVEQVDRAYQVSVAPKSPEEQAAASARRRPTAEAVEAVLVGQMALARTAEVLPVLTAAEVVVEVLAEEP
jgi:hypothetical protein